MRLIDADKLNRKKKYSFQTKFGCFPKNEWFIKLEDLFRAPTIDPIHAAGGCYCRECIKSDLLDDRNGYYCDKGITMPINGFCSGGVKNNNEP